MSFYIMSKYTKAYLAYAFIAVIWGTTYLGIKLAITHYPPFFMAGVRQTFASAIVFFIVWIFKKNINLSWSNIFKQGIIGFLLITLGNGLITWAELYVNSSTAAIICATMPIITILLNTLLGKEKFHASTLIGMMLGFLGVFLIIYNKTNNPLDNDSLSVVYVIMIFIATVSWAYGSILNKQSSSHNSTFFNIGLQMFIGGILLLITSPLVDDFSNFEPLHTQSILAILYLIIFGSILAFTAYIYALKVLPVSFVNSYAYINPIVASIVGYLWLNETLNIYTFLSITLIIIGILISRYHDKKNKLTNVIIED